MKRTAFIMPDREDAIIIELIDGNVSRSFLSEWTKDKRDYSSAWKVAAVAIDDNVKQIFRFDCEANKATDDITADVVGAWLEGLDDDMLRDWTEGELPLCVQDNMNLYEAEIETRKERGVPLHEIYGVPARM